jgi:hemerythrin
MALIEWSDSMSVKIPSIDEQHKKLIAMVNTLHEGIAKGNSKEVLVDVFDGLAEYTVEHFGYEEKFFKEFDYEDSEKHISEHQDLVQQVVELKQKLDNEEGFMFGLEVMDFLKNWLTEHIMGSDMDYSSFFVSKDVK